MKFFIRKIDFSKEKAFGKYIIRYRNALEKILGVYQFFQLFITFSHEKKLQRECVLFRILIEFRQKRVFGESLQDKTGIEMSGKQVGKRGFSCADISFHRNKM